MNRTEDMKPLSTLVGLRPAMQGWARTFANAGALALGVRLGVGAAQSRQICI